jgi:hypothetical protein
LDQFVARRGLAAEGFDISDGKTKSGDFGVIADLKKTS